jgi:hypothetical protein
VTGTSADSINTIYFRIPIRVTEHTSFEYVGDKLVVTRIIAEATMMTPRRSAKAAQMQK